MAKFLKVISVIFLCLLIVFISGLIAYLVITKDAALDESKLIDPNQNILIYDDDNDEIVSASLVGKRKSVSIKALKPETVNAFIASEDRSFYTHNGINYRRMIKALFTNIKAGAFKEGASTISQQLIKNTHLSGDKTISRKLKEIKLTKQLERRFSKDEILEMYLNTIYFGHNCYGLQSAAEFYFDKKAESLSLEESATLVGLLISPNNYSPFKHPEKSLSRRNVVLKSMLDCKFIDESVYNAAVNSPLETKTANTGGKNSDYLNAVFDELEDLGLDFYSLNDGCIIKTYLKPDLQNFIENMDFDCDNSVIITTDGRVSAYKSTINGAPRQPGSTIKPLLVYAPAIEEKIVSPFTKILDEPIDYGGYAPENFDKKFHGYVTVTDSIKQSYNVPAVKTLNSLTIKTAEKYLDRMDVKLENGEKNLSLALGGMTHGLSLKDIADRYSIFADGGVYSPSHFIKEVILSDGTKVYTDEQSKSRVFSEGTASLMNEILLETAKSGTAKKLSGLKYDVAAKTGTCGNREGNTDAYAVSYTSEHTVGVWLGDKDNNRLDITGGGDCCNYAKAIYNKLYENHTPTALETNSGTVKVDIDAEEYYKNNKIIKSDPIAPKLNVLTVKVLSGNEPKQTSDKFSNPKISIPSISVQNDGICIKLCQTKYYAYLINRQFDGKSTTIYDGKWKENIIDTPEAGYYTYTVTPYYLYGDKKIYGQEITLPAVNYKVEGSKQEQLPDIVQKDWFNL